jgi:hypothetical protein
LDLCKAHVISVANFSTAIVSSVAHSNEHAMRKAQKPVSAHQQIAYNVWRQIWLSRIFTNLRKSMYMQ